jgi:hypothetical protein
MCTIAESVVTQKFQKVPGLRDELLSTGSKLIVEASPNDAIWGVRESLPRIQPLFDTQSMLSSHSYALAIDKIRQCSFALATDAWLTLHSFTIATEAIPARLVSFIYSCHRSQACSLSRSSDQMTAKA